MTSEPPDGLLTDVTTVGGLLLRSARLWPEADSLVEGDLTLSHAQAASQALAVAQRLADRGVRPGDRVAFALTSGWRYAVAYYGALLAGATAVLLNTRFTPPEMEYVLADSASSLVVVDAETAVRVPEVCPRADAAELTEPGPQASSPPGLAAAGKDVANILYTSGTTGHPKGAMQTHANLIFNARTVGRVTGVSEADRTLVVAPMFHATGIVSQLVGFGAHGAARVFQPKFSAAGMLGELVRHRVTFFAGVTAMIQLMLTDPDLESADISALRTVVFGGAPVAEAFQDFAVPRMPGVRFANVWGLTEATSIVTCAIGQEWRDRPWSVGRPVPGVQVAVVPDGEEPDQPGAHPEATGELWVRGPLVSAGYWNQPEATAAAFRADGWLRTGDVGRVDADGYVQVLDRLKDMIIRGGENIYSLEVESVLARHPAIADVSVVGVPDHLFGERVRAVVVPRAGQSLALGDLREWAGAQLADYKLPVELVTVSELPRNAAGKVIKKRLAEFAADTPAAGVRP